MHDCVCVFADILFGVLLPHLLFVQRLWMVPASKSALLNIIMIIIIPRCTMINVLYCYIMTGEIGELISILTFKDIMYKI